MKIISEEMLFGYQNEMVFFIPGTDSKIFQGARRVFTFHIEIFSLLSELANSVMKRSKCEKWKLFKPLEKFKQKGLGWVICFLRLIEIYLYAIIISTYKEKLTVTYKEILLLFFLSFFFLILPPPTVPRVFVIFCSYQRY